MKRVSRKRPRRKHGIKRIYLLPNLFTTGNIVCGVMSVMFTVQGRFGAAANAILVGCLFDLLDGRIARLTNTGSPFGVNYDSLSDLVTFGVAPGVLIFKFLYQPADRFLLPVVVIYTVCCALRLARFNVQASTAEKKGFKGLPTPAAAALLATMMLFLFVGEESILEPQGKASGLLIQILAVVLAGLMVSEIPYPVLDTGVLRRRHPFHYLVILLITLGFIIASPPLTLFAGFSLYVLYGLFRHFAASLRPSGMVEEHPEPAPETDTR